MQNQIKKPNKNFAKPLIIAILVIYSIIVLFPMLWVLMSSLKTNAEFVQKPWVLPSQLQFKNYANAWVGANLQKYALNSIIITLSSIGILVFFVTPTTYILVKLKIKCSKLLLFLFTAGLYVPVALVLPTEFLLVNNIGLYNSQFGLILLYVAFSLPLSVLILSGFYSSLPNEILEAAKIDGCTLNQCFWRVVFPMSKNGVSTIVIMNLVWIWNDYIFSLTFLKDSKKMSLPVGLIGLMDSFKLKADWVTLFAGLCFVMIPTIIIFFICQKSMTEGMTAGGLKE